MGFTKATTTLRCCLLLISFSAFCRGETREGGRYWYDQSCNERISASVIDRQGKFVTLRTDDGDELERTFDSFYLSDQAYLNAYSLCLAAVPHTDRSPYVRGDRSLTAIRDWLVERKIPIRDASALTKSGNKTNDRTLDDLKNRWIEIRGIQYEVTSTQLSDLVVGVEEIVVRLHNEQEVIVPPSQVAEITILHQGWQKSTYRAEINARSPVFRRRGPPSRSTFLPADRWQQKLVFDTVFRVWTDSESARAHQLRDYAKSWWDRCDNLTLVAEARWHVHRGKEQVAQGDLPAAIEHFSVAINKAPTFAEAYLRRGQVHQTLNQNRIALTDLDESIKIGAKQQERGWKRLYVLLPAHVARAEIYSEERQHDTAIANARLAVELNPYPANNKYDRLLFDVRLTAANDKAAQAEQIIAVFRVGGDPGEDGFETAIGLADQAAKKYNPDPTETRFSTLALECRKQFARYFKRRAERAYAVKQYDEAIKLAQGAIDRNPVRSDTQFTELLERMRAGAATDHAGRAVSALARRSYNSAVENAETALRLGPDSMRAGTRELLAECYYKRATESHFPERRFNEAIEDLDKHLAITPDKLTAYYYRGLSLSMVGKLNRALDDIDRVKDAGVRSEHLLLTRALLLTDLGRLGKAVTQLKELETLNPRDSYYIALRSELHYKMGHLAQAKTAIDAAIRRDDTNAGYYMLRAQIFRRQVDFDNALADANVAIRLRPGWPKAVEFKQWLEQRQASEDPYYVDDRQLLWAIGELVLASVAEYKKDIAAEDFHDSKGFRAKIGPTVRVGLWSLGNSLAVSDAVDRIWPNLPPRDKTLAETLINQIIDAGVDAFRGKQVSLKELIGAAGENIAKDEVKRWVLRDKPDWKIGVSITDLLYGVVREIQSKSDTGMLTPPTKTLIAASLPAPETGCIDAADEASTERARDDVEHSGHPCLSPLRNCPLHRVRWKPSVSSGLPKRAVG